MDEQPEIAVKSTAIQRAKDTLLRVLDQLEQAEADLGDVSIERVHVVVVYDVGAVDPEDGAWHTVGGWSSTPGSKWEHAALLRRAAEAQDEADRPIAEDDEEDDID